MKVNRMDSCSQWVRNVTEVSERHYRNVYRTASDSALGSREIWVLGGARVENQIRNELSQSCYCPLAILVK